MERKKLLIRVVILIFLIFIVNFLAGKFYWYSAIWYFDMIMHFWGGFWVALASIFLFPPKSNQIEVSFIFKIIFFVFLVGISWEVFEFIFYNYIALNSFNITDTASDIFFDLLGGILALFYYVKSIMIKSENTVHPVVEL